MPERRQLTEGRTFEGPPTARRQLTEGTPGQDLPTTRPTRVTPDPFPGGQRQLGPGRVFTGPPMAKIEGQEVLPGVIYNGRSEVSPGSGAFLEYYTLGGGQGTTITVDPTGDVTRWAQQQTHASELHWLPPFRQGRSARRLLHPACGRGSAVTTRLPMRSCA